MSSMKVNIGIEDKKREEIALGLSKLLADTYTLYLKTHNFHWNVVGPHFQALHQMFEKQYEDLADAVDLIAERIRALGFPAPATYSQFVKLSSIQENEGVPEAMEMVRILVEGHEIVVRTCRSNLPAIERVDDQPTMDLIAVRMNIHEKAAWMLRSILEVPASQQQGFTQKKSAA